MKQLSKNSCQFTNYYLMNYCSAMSFKQESSGNFKNQDAHHILDFPSMLHVRIEQKEPSKMETIWWDFLKGKYLWIYSSNCNLTFVNSKKKLVSDLKTLIFFQQTCGYNKRLSVWTFHSREFFLSSKTFSICNRNIKDSEIGSVSSSILRRVTIFTALCKFSPFLLVIFPHFCVGISNLRVSLDLLSVRFFFLPLSLDL